jgi:Cu(I)/Ag(I) efflux system membrane fusion protein
MGEAPSAAPSPATEHQGEGKIEAINKQFVTLSHDPISSLQWGAMTMEFGLPRSGVPAGLRLGQRVRFALTVGKDGEPTLTRIEPMSSASTPTNPGAKP